MYVFEGGILVKRGIEFPATPFVSSNVNTLDDYEEGTWTPVVSGASGGVMTTYTSYGRYTKIGNLVNVDIELTLTNIGTCAGQAMHITMPSVGTPLATPRGMITGAEWASTGKMASGVIGVGGAAYCLEYNGNSPFTNAYNWNFTGHFYV